MLKSIKQNAVALISLVVAVTALGSSHWRDEVTDQNRNIRQASFEILKELSSLQLIIDYAHYDKDEQKGNPITGWGHIGLINDLSTIIPEPTPSRVAKLNEVWQNEWQKVRDDVESNQKISEEIKKTRAAVL